MYDRHTLFLRTSYFFPGRDLLETPTSALWDDCVNHGANQKRQQAEHSWALFDHCGKLWWSFNIKFVLYRFIMCARINLTLILAKGFCMY